MSFEKDLKNLESALFPNKKNPCKNSKVLYKLVYAAAVSYLKEYASTKDSLMAVKNDVTESYIIDNSKKSWFRFTRYKINYKKLKTLSMIDLLEIFKTCNSNEVHAFADVNFPQELISYVETTRKSNMHRDLTRADCVAYYKTHCVNGKNNTNKIVEKMNELVEEILGKNKIYVRKPWFVLKYGKLSDDNLWRITKLLSRQTIIGEIVDAWAQKKLDFGILKITNNFSRAVVEVKLHQG